MSDSDSGLSPIADSPKKDHKKKSKKEKKHGKKKEKKDKSKKEKKEKKAGPSERPDGGPTLSTDDFFNKNPEFRVWLAEKKRLFFDELKDKETRSHFKKFVKKWNSGDLDSKFYKGMAFADIDPALRTRHKWKFQNVSKTELENARDSVHSSTSRNMLAPEKKIQGPTLPEAPPTGTGASTINEKTYLKRRKEDIEELVPKPDLGSHAARQDKKRAKGAYCRGRDDASPDREADLGSNHNDFQRRVAQQRDARLAKEAELQVKVDAYEEKERERMKQFLDGMGLANKFSRSGE